MLSLIKGDYSELSKREINKINDYIESLGLEFYGTNSGAIGSISGPAIGFEFSTDTQKCFSKSYDYVINHLLFDKGKDVLDSNMCVHANFITNIHDNEAVADYFHYDENYNVIDDGYFIQRA